jgi:hypothetical protein
MSTKILLICIALAVLGSVSFTSCGPSCPEVKAALDEEEAMAGDVARINALVDKRLATIAEAEQGGHDNFYMQRLKFSVTAYELAVKLQVRIIKISPRYEDSELYGEHANTINEIRCDLDDIVAKDGHTVGDADGSMLQKHYARLSALLRKAGDISGSELKTYLEEGIGRGGE